MQLERKSPQSCCAGPYVKRKHETHILMHEDALSLAWVPKKKSYVQMQNEKEEGEDT